MTPETEVHSRLNAINRKSLLALWTLFAWLVGAVFWAGSSYQRFQSMDKHLEAIDTKLDRMSQLDVIRQRQDDNMRRIEVLEKTMMELREKR